MSLSEGIPTSPAGSHIAISIEDGVTVVDCVGIGETFPMLSRSEALEFERTKAMAHRAYASCIARAYETVGKALITEFAAEIGSIAPSVVVELVQRVVRANADSELALALGAGAFERAMEARSKGAPAQALDELGTRANAALRMSGAYTAIAADEFTKATATVRAIRAQSPSTPTRFN